MIRMQEEGKKNIKDETKLSLEFLVLDTSNNTRIANLFPLQPSISICPQTLENIDLLS